MDLFMIPAKRPLKKMVVSKNWFMFVLLDTIRQQAITSTNVD